MHAHVAVPGITWDEGVAVGLGWRDGVGGRGLAWAGAGGSWPGVESGWPGLGGVRLLSGPGLAIALDAIWLVAVA